jgi:hypothetical protein
MRVGRVDGGAVLNSSRAWILDFGWLLAIQIRAAISLLVTALNTLKQG